MCLIWPAFMSWRNDGFPSPPPAEVLHERDAMVKRTMFQRSCFVAEDDHGDAYLGVALATAELGESWETEYAYSTEATCRLCFDHPIQRLAVGCHAMLVTGKLWRNAMSTVHGWRSCHKSAN